MSRKRTSLDAILDLPPAERAGAGGTAGAGGRWRRRGGRR